MNNALQEANNKSGDAQIGLSLCRLHATMSNFLSSWPLFASQPHSIIVSLVICITLCTLYFMQTCQLNGNVPKSYYNFRYA